MSENFLSCQIEIPQLQEGYIEKLLVSYKKCNSHVEGDIPKDLINPNEKKTSRGLNTNLQ